MGTPALFLPHDAPDGPGLVLPSEFSRSVWSLDLVHGAAVAALLARTVEGAVRPGLRVVRLTVDLMRAVPLVPLATNAELVRDGRRIQVIEAGLRNANGVEMARATALAMWESEILTQGVLQRDAATPPDPDSLPTMPLKLKGQGGAYHTSTEWRSPAAWGTSESPMLWIRNPTEILPGEPLSPLARAVATADALSPLANFAPPFADESIGFINADISLYLHREPLDEWLCVVATSRQGGKGYAVSDGALYDRRGPLGRIALASLAQQQRPLGII